MCKSGLLTSQCKSKQIDPELVLFDLETSGTSRGTFPIVKVKVEKKRWYFMLNSVLAMQSCCSSITESLNVKCKLNLQTANFPWARRKRALNRGLIYPLKILLERKKRNPRGKLMTWLILSNDKFAMRNEIAKRSELGSWDEVSQVKGVSIFKWQTIKSKWTIYIYISIYI